MFNEDVMEHNEEYEVGYDVRIIDQEYLEKPFQVKIISGKVSKNSSIHFCCLIYDLVIKLMDCAG